MKTIFCWRCDMGGSFPPDGVAYDVSERKPWWMQRMGPVMFTKKREGVPGEYSSIVRCMDEESCEHRQGVRVRHLCLGKVRIYPA